MRNALAHDWDTIAVLWRRDLMRFFRQPSRLVGALGQPIIFWGVIGSGMTQTFRLNESGGDYMTFFFPGVVMMVLVFASIFASVGVIEDRHQGFLQAVMVEIVGRALVSAVHGEFRRTTSIPYQPSTLNITKFAIAFKG